jgi:hypothetical protein
MSRQLDHQNTKRAITYFFKIVSRQQGGIIDIGRFQTENELLKSILKKHGIHIPTRFSDF